MSTLQKLSLLPILSGVSQETLAATVGKYRFEFRKYLPKQVIVEQGTPCREVIFILSGRARSLMTLTDGYDIERTLGEYSVLYPEYLFGRSTDYPASVTALTAVSAVAIAKADFLDMVTSDHVYMLNYLNMLSRKAQLPLEVAASLAASSLPSATAAIDALLL